MAVFSMSAEITDSQRDSLVANLKSDLKDARTARDSVRILYNIFDLSNLQQMADISWTLYETAVRADDQAAQLDMLRNMGSFYVYNDSVISELLNKASHIQNLQARKATQTFITNQYFSKMKGNPGNRDYELAMLDSINGSHDPMSTDKYDKLSLLYQLLVFLGPNSEGALFNDIFNKYEKLVDELPMGDYPLKNQYLIFASSIYTRYKQYQKAIYCEFKLLDISDKLQQRNIKRNRIYRSYDVVKYRCFERIMCNFPALAHAQIESVHDSMQYYYNRSSRVRAYANKTNLKDALYLYATKQYAKAIPELKQALNSRELSEYQKVTLYDYLAIAAKATGDTNTQIWAMEEARKQINMLDSVRRNTATREIEIRDYFKDKPIFYEVDLEKQKADETAETQKIIMMIVSSLVALLLVVFMIMYFKLRTSKGRRR